MSTLVEAVVHENEWRKRNDSLHVSAVEHQADIELTAIEVYFRAGQGLLTCVPFVAAL